MTVYAEVLFVENFIAGGVILALTGKLCGAGLNRCRITAGAAMCGIYAFVLFVPLHFLAGLVTKLLFSAVVTLVTFKMDSIRGWLKITGVFYITSFLMGGVTIAIMNMLQIPGMAGNGSFLIQNTAANGATREAGVAIKCCTIAGGIALTWHLGNWLSRLLKEKLHKEQILHQVVIAIGEKKWQIKGLIDTGNSLSDPLTGVPVAVASKSLGGKIKLELGDDIKTRQRIIPYRSVGNTGTLEGIRADGILTASAGWISPAIIAIADYDFALWHGIEKYDILLHQQLLEGEKNND